VIVSDLLATLEIPARKHGFLVGKFWAYAFPVLAQPLEVHGITLDLKAAMEDFSERVSAVEVFELTRLWRQDSCLRFVIDGAEQLALPAEEVPPSTRQAVLSSSSGQPLVLPGQRDVSLAGRPLTGKDWRVGLVVSGALRSWETAPCTTVLKFWGKPCASG